MELTKENILKDYCNAQAFHILKGYTKQNTEFIKYCENLFFEIYNFRIFETIYFKVNLQKHIDFWRSERKKKFEHKHYNVDYVVFNQDYNQLHCN